MSFLQLSFFKSRCGVSAALVVRQKLCGPADMRRIAMKRLLCRYVAVFKGRNSAGIGYGAPTVCSRARNRRSMLAKLASGNGTPPLVLMITCDETAGCGRDDSFSGLGKAREQGVLFYDYAGRTYADPESTSAMRCRPDMTTVAASGVVRTGHASFPGKQHSHCRVRLLEPCRRGGKRWQG
jgi:hypothetical protein